MAVNREAAEKLFELLATLPHSEPTVCTTHMRHVPCRRNDGCVFSDSTEDVRRVRDYQQDPAR